MNRKRATSGVAKSTHLWRSHAPFRGLLEGVGELNEPWFAACQPGEAHAERCWICFEAFWEGGCGGVRHEAKRDDDCRITRFRRNGVAIGTREKECVQPVLLHDGIDPIRGTEQQVLGAI